MSKPNFRYFPNPNKEEYEMVAAAVNDNDGYCCCAIEKNEDTKCMCKEFRESEVSGFCHGRKFYKVRQNETVGILVDITDEAGADAFQTWFARLSQEDFVVIPIIHNAYDFRHTKDQHIDVSKVAISRCDALFVINIEGENERFMAEMVEWAEDLGKKIIYRDGLKNET